MQRSRRWRGWRWILRGGLGLVAIVTLTVAAAVIASHTSWGREVIRAQVEKRLQTVFTGGASLGGVEGSPFGKLTLHELVIHGPDRQPAISVKTLTVELGILPLLSHEAKVGDVVAEDVDIDLKRDARGELQIKQLLRPGPSSGWSVYLPGVELRRAHVKFDAGTEVMNFDAVTLDAWAKMPHGGPIDASLELHGSWRERTAAKLDLQVALHSGDDGLALPYLLARAGEVSVIGNHVTILPTGDGRVPVIAGALIINAGAAAVRRLVPEVQLPADLAITIAARPLPGQPWTELAVAGTIDHTPVQFTGTVDLDARHARGTLATGTVDLAKLTSGRIAGDASASIVFDARPGGPRALPVATATIKGWAALDGVPRTAFEIGVSSAGERVRATIDATSDGVRAQLAASVRMVGDLLAIEDATLHATSSDPARASGGRAPVHGVLRADLTASGVLLPTPSLAVAGTVDGRNLRMNDLSVASLHLAIDAKRLPNRPLGSAQVKLVDLVRGDMQLGELTVDAADRADGKIAVSVRSRPKQNRWLLDADALVTPPAGAGPSTIAIELLRHRVRAGNGQDWTGHTGHVEIGPERIAVRDLQSVSAVGRLAVSGSYERAGRRQGDLAVKLDASGLLLDNLAGAYHGKLDAHLAVARRGGAWDGEVQLDGTRVSFDPSTVMLDGHVHAALHGTRLAVTADGSSLGLGSAKLALDLDAPARTTDPAAWKRLGRSAIRTGRLTLQGIELRRAAELAGLTGEYAGKIDGDIQISSTTTAGRIEVKNVTAPELHGLTDVSAVLELSQPSPVELAPTLTITAGDIGRVIASAQLEAPDRLFDPAAWQRLGRGALRSASVRAENINVDPAMLERLGVVSEMRGRVSVVVDVGEAGRTAKATVDVAELRGEPIVQPIDVHLDVALGERTSTTTLSVTAKGSPLLALQGEVPVSLAQLIEHQGAGAEAIQATPLKATLKLAQVDAPRLLAVFGRTEVIAGTLDGSVELGGTLGKPTVKASLVALALKVPPGPRGKPVRIVDKLTITGAWDGTTAKLDVDGTESEGGTLKIAAVARPAALRDGTLTIKATKFDLVPILVFLPGPAGGAAGQLDADLRFTGLDLRTSQIAGELHLLEARVPIAPSVGTLRRAKIDAVIADHSITLVVDGKLGAGSVAVTGSVALDGLAPNGGKAKITLRKVSPIGVVEPQITADISANLSRTNDQWRAELVVDRGNVVLSEDRGEKLKPVGAPTDMVFANGKRLTGRPLERRAPTNPLIVVSVDLRSTRVESEEFRGLIRGKVELQADGDSVAMYGGIDADRGDLDLFGRRYHIERAGVNFDGPLDPLLDIRITHDFPDVTTVTEVRGRASNPELFMSSDPGTFSQGQLLGFLLGGDPAGDPQTGAAGDRVADAGASFVANRLGGYVRDALPIDIDVLRYEVASATSSAAVLVGSWITHSLFVAYRQHLEARPDENLSEGELEYWLSRRVVIEATAGNRVNGVDLLWRKRY